MRKSYITTFSIFVLVFAIALTAVFASDFSQSVARATGTETFIFDADDNKFVVTVKSTGEEIYRSHFDEDAILSAIKSVVGDEDYLVELTAPTVTLTLTSGETKMPYGDTNSFQFKANAIHGFENLGIMGYRGADPSNDYLWHFSRNGGVETKFGGYGADMPFGAKNAFGEYEIYAYATISLTFDGVKYTATGKSKGFEIEIEKSSANLPDVSEDALNVTHAYGKTLAEIVDAENVSSRNFAFVLPKDNDGKEILGVGTHGVEVEYAVGTWAGGVFTKDESVESVILPLTVNINPYNVYILLHHVTVKQGDEIKFTYELIAPSALPNNEKTTDLKLNIYAEGDTTEPGQYTIKGESGNPNYRVYFCNYENRDNRDYSTWATLTVRPAQLTIEDGGLRYTLFRNEGFQYGDQILLLDTENGGKTLKVYNNYESVTYTDLKLTIEKIADNVDYISVTIGNDKRDLHFGESGVITINYSTEQASEFSCVVVLKDVDDTPNNIAYAGILVGLAAVLLGVYSFLRRRNWPRDIYVRETRPEKEEETAKDDAVKTSVEEKVESVEVKTESKKRVLTLEEKLSLHPDFEPTPSLEEAFKESDNEEDADEDKDVDEGADEGKITFKSKMLSASTENKAIYNALKNELLSYRGIKSRVVNGGDYFRRPGKQIVKIIFIGKTIRLALALNPQDYDYNLYHQKDRGNMKKYADTPMFVKVQSLLGVRRAVKLISDLMEKEGVKRNKKYIPDDFMYDLTYGVDGEEN